MRDLFSPVAPAKRGQWPSEQLADYLTGRVDPDDVASPIKSWAAFFIHDAAKQVMAIDTREKRRAALGKVPPHIRPLVEKEVMRLWGA